VAERPKPSDPAGAAIVRAEALIGQLETEGRTDPSLLVKAGKKLPPVRDWRIPVLIALLLIAGQAVAALMADDGTVAAIFAVGAVTVAVLTGIVAALSYAQQSAIPFSDLLAVLKELLAALKAIKGKQDGS
jgi:hypothetical protein